MDTKKHVPLLIGAHMSIAKGFEKAVFDTTTIGANCIQIFTKSNRQWKARALTQKQINDFYKALIDAHINPKHVFVHASYLINCASSNTELRKKSIDALILEIERCQKLGISYLVLHPGTSKESNEKALLLLADSLNQALEQTSDTVSILLENMAGQGSSLGSTFKELAQIKKLIHDKKRIYFCVDTCHAFAAGYDLREKQEYEKIITEIDQTIGLDHIKLIHLNDSKKNVGSNVDRHENIAKGKLGAAFFKRLCTDKRFINIPKILETPKEILDDHKQDIEKIKKLIES